MLKDISYDILKKEERNYSILLLHDQQGKSFTALARMYAVSIVRIRQIYNRLKFRQIRLYLNHLAVALGHDSLTEINALYQAALDCYRSPIYACAYLEKKYNRILTAYRNGEPGMPQAFLRALPPFRRSLGQKEISRIIELRETQKYTFKKIAQELRITPEKAESVYEHFYHTQVMALIEAMIEKAATEEEKEKIWNDHLHNQLSSKRRYEQLTKQ